MGKIERADQDLTRSTVVFGLSVGDGETVGGAMFGIMSASVP